MEIDVRSGNVDWRDVYKLCISFINPRPIALVSTLGPDGSPNLAPFSFFNMVSARPPVVIICPGLKRDGSSKDTLVNIEATEEFVIATVTRDFGQRAVDCAAALPYGTSEFEFSGLTMAPSRFVRPSLVAEAKVNIECSLRQTVKTGDGPGSSRVIFGDVLMIHVVDDVLDEATRECDPHKLITVGRLGGQWYCDVQQPYEMRIPNVEST